MRAARNQVQWGHRLHSAIDGYSNGLVRLVGESYGRHTLQTAWKEFDGASRQPFMGDDGNAELFYSWFFHKWSPAPARGYEISDKSLYGIPPTRAYLDRCSDPLNPLLRIYLETCLKTWPRFYEIFDCDPGVGFRAQDVFSHLACTVIEPLASLTVASGDILYAHLVPISGATVMEAIAPLSFPQNSKQHLFELCREVTVAEIDGAQLRSVYFELFSQMRGRSD